MKDRRTRPLNSKSDWTCPRHGTQVQERIRRRLDESTGRTKFGGIYYRCPHYSECGYYVGADEGVVPITSEDGIALHRLEGNDDG